MSAFSLHSAEWGHRVLASRVDYAGRWGTGSLTYFLPATSWRPTDPGFEERALEGVELGVNLKLTTTVREPDRLPLGSRRRRRRLGRGRAPRRRLAPAPLAESLRRLRRNRQEKRLVVVSGQGLRSDRWSVEAETPVGKAWESCPRTSCPKSSTSGARRQNRPYQGRQANRDSHFGEQGERPAPAKQHRQRRGAPGETIASGGGARRCSGEGATCAGDGANPAVPGVGFSLTESSRRRFVKARRMPWFRSRSSETRECGNPAVSRSSRCLRTFL